MFTDKQINQLRIRIKAGGVVWIDFDNMPHPVAGVNLKWVEDKSQPKLTEPVAVLKSGRVVSLNNVEVDTFVSQQPLILGDPMVPTSYLERVSDGFALLCNGNRPTPKMLEDWVLGTNERLQDWAVNNMAVYWGTGIGTIDAAFALAETPEEGISEGKGKEHQTREEAFPSLQIKSDSTE